uniref:MD-2-related lipid-recognition domain-containing protein n=1 Tax=Ascaris lumbricoides TaxID=6252 RepID=A0A9J2PMH9_ASCLU
MTDSDRVEAVQRRGVAEHRTRDTKFIWFFAINLKLILHHLPRCEITVGSCEYGYESIIENAIHSAQQQINSRANQWQPHHAVQIPTQGTIPPHDLYVFLGTPTTTTSASPDVLACAACVVPSITDREKANIKKSSIKQDEHQNGELRARGTEESFGYADGKTEHSSSSPPSVMDRLKGWIKRQSPFRDERPIIDGRMGGTTCNDKSIYSHYFDSELDKLTPVPSSTLTRADLRKQTLSKSHDFPLIGSHNLIPKIIDEDVLRENLRNEESEFERNMAVTFLCLRLQSIKVDAERLKRLERTMLNNGQPSVSARDDLKQSIIKPFTPLLWRLVLMVLAKADDSEESEFERNMAVTFLCLRLQSIKVDAERLKRLERTMLNNGQPSVSAREAMEWLLSHGDRIQENARKASEKLRAVFADISIPVECAVKVLEIFVRNGALFRKKDTEIKCTEFFGFRKTVSMDDITDILYYLAREQVHRGQTQSNQRPVMPYYVAFLALLSVSFAQQQQQQQQLQQRQRLQPALRATQCPYPNCTATAIHTFNCDTEHKMLVRSAKVLDEDGSEMYPINFRKPIIIVLEAENNGDVYYDNKVSVIISKYSKSWFSSTCQWTEIPTFGLLNKLDGCDLAHNCPLQKGKLDLRLPLDVSGLSGIIGMLAGNTPYELQIKMYNGNPGVTNQEEIACVITQMKIAA